MQTGIISKIQKYSTKDGPGIRSTVFCVGCNLRCIWCSNPELIENKKQILYYRQLCVRCGSCAAVSGGTITVGPEGMEIDRKRCVNLAECAAVCDHGAYEFIGREITPRELVKLLLRDKVFYDQSGGGVTFSGGEPALQPDFVSEASALLKEAGVHTALDTAGCVKWETLKTAAENMDLILYDIKTFDDDIHRRCTGESNVLALENAKRLAQMNKPMFVRLIVAAHLRQFNDNIDFEKRLDFVKSLNVDRIDILPFHKLASGKYRALGITDPTEDEPECPPEAVTLALAAAERKGLTVFLSAPPLQKYS